MQSVKEVITMTSGNPNLGDVQAALEIARELDVIGRPLAVETSDTVPMFSYNPNQKRVVHNNYCDAGVIIGAFGGIYVATTTELSEEGTDSEDSIMALVQDPSDKSVLYGIPAGTDEDIDAISDVMVDLKDDGLAVDIEQLLACESIDLFALAACYRQIQSPETIRLAQYAAHAQYLFRPSNLCTSITTEVHYVDVEREEAFFGHNYLPTMVGDNDVAYVGMDEDSTFLTFMSSYPPTSSSPLVNRRINLNRQFVGYTRPN